MAKEAEANDKNRKKSILPLWLRTGLWSTFGVVLALTIIGLLILPIIWLIWFVFPTGPSNGVDQGRIAQTGTAQVSLTQTGIAETNENQASAAQDSRGQTGTAQAIITERAVDQTQSAQTGTAQATPDLAETDRRGPDQTAAAQTVMAQTSTAQTASAASTVISTAGTTLTPDTTAAPVGSQLDTPTLSQAAPSDTPPTPSATPIPPTPTPTATVAPLIQGDIYIVQRDDWLSKLSDKSYADVGAYWPIMAATNKANAVDSTFAKIEDPDIIEIGDKLLIPPVEEALAFMTDFDPETEQSRLFATGSQGQLVLASWWASRSGPADILGLYRDENPGVEVVDVNLADGAGINFREANLDNLIGGDPYDGFQVHAGLEVEFYTPAEFLVPVDDVLEDSGLLEVIPTDLRDLLEISGSIYVVPLNIHRGNVMWANMSLLEQAGVAIPATFEEFFTVCDTLQAQGIVPLGMGTADGFELSHTMEIVIAGTLGADKSQGLWRGAVSWRDPDIARALENFGRLLDCSNADRDSLGWIGGIERVISDQAAFNLMGDWAHEQVIADIASGKMAWSPSPGAQNQYLLVSEGFAFSQAAPNPANARAFADLIARRDTQEAFSRNKGSLCARSDCDYSLLPDDRRAYVQQAADALASDIVVPMVTYGSGASPAWQEQFSQIAIQFAATRDVAATQAALVLAAENAGFSQ